MAQRFDLLPVMDDLPDNLPLGVRQRLSLAVAVVHNPEILILDEPTSGVDPIARDNFWRLIIDLSRKDGVTIFITTHFMNEAERCDRISLMHNGKSLTAGKPEDLVKERKAKNLEEAFIGYLIDAGAGTGDEGSVTSIKAKDATISARTEKREAKRRQHASFSLRRLASCIWREALELYRDPICLTLALLGSIILMLVIGFGITMDVENLRFAVLDRDQSGLSRNYVLNISGSRYFTEQPPIIDYADLDHRMRSGDIALAVEIPPNFGRDVQRSQPTQIALWVDGAMPQRAETINGYVEGMHQEWLAQQITTRLGLDIPSLATIETRYRYNPDVKSLPAMVPATIPLLLLMIPAILAALAVVREKELGSIINLYVTPLTKTEFIIGKQVPYIILSMISFILMTIMAQVVFNVPVKGSFPTLFLAAFLFCIISTGMGLLASTVTKSQIAVMFLTLIGTLLPAIQFSGLLNSVSSLGGAGRFIGTTYPATYMLIISRGIFNKALHFSNLYGPLLMLVAAIPVIVGLSIALLRKQES